MYLTSHQIKLLARRLWGGLGADKKYITAKKSPVECITKIEHIIQNELKLLDEVNEVAKKMLDEILAKSPQPQGEVDKEKLYNMIRKQLIKEKKIIL